MSEKRKHKYFDVIVAWAAGNSIQYKQNDSTEWVDYISKSYTVPNINDDNEWRIKPNMHKQWYRIALCKTTAKNHSCYLKPIFIFSVNEILNEPYDKGSSVINGFVKWLTEWIAIEYET